MTLEEMTLRQINESFVRKEDYWTNDKLGLLVYDTDPKSKRILVLQHGIVVSSYLDSITNQHMVVIDGEVTMFIKLLKILRGEIPEHLLDVRYHDVEYFLPKLMITVPQYVTLRGELRHYLVDLYDSNTDTLHSGITKKVAIGIMHCSLGMLLDMLPEYAYQKLDFDGYRVRSHRDSEFIMDAGVEKDSALFKGIYLVSDTYNNNEVYVYDDVRKVLDFINADNAEEDKLSLGDLRRYFRSGEMYTNDLNGYSCRRIEDINGVSLSYASLSKLRSA